MKRTDFLNEIILFCSDKIEWMDLQRGHNGDMIY